MRLITDYDKIIKVIEFFSQDLHEEQFSKYGYPFLHDLLGLKKSVLYMLKDLNDIESPYVSIHKINAEIDVKVIKYSKALSNLAVLHGRYLTHGFEQYFSEDFITNNTINLVIPIINESTLYGFIISEGKFPYDENLDLLHVINIIMNMSFSHIVDQKILKKRSSLLRNEVYNLNMLTHLIGEIVAEKDLEKLYNICVDSIRELTASSYTTVVFHDEFSDKFVTKASKDIVEQNNLLLNYQLKPYELSKIKKIYDVDQEFEMLEKIFVNAKNFKKIKAKYILMMFDEKLQGFITIGEAVNKKVINESILYKINTIAHFILIAVKNANYIKKIEGQNRLIENQISTMKNLNQSLTVINACESLEELVDVVMTTLEVQFDIEKCFYFSKLKKESRVISNNAIDEGIIINEEKLPSTFDYNYENESIIDVLNIDSEKHNCLIVAPIKVKSLDKEEIVGYFIITKVKEKLEEYQITAMKTISQLISPVVKSFMKVKYIENHYLIDEEKMFLSKVKEALQGKKEYDLDFYILYKQVNLKPFQKAIEKEPGTFIFNDYSFKIVYEEDNSIEPWRLIEVDSINELIEHFNI